MKSWSSISRLVGMVSAAWLLPWAAAEAQVVKALPPDQEPVAVTGERAACMGLGNTCTTQNPCESEICVTVGDQALCLTDFGACTAEADCNGRDCYVFEGTQCTQGDGNCSVGFECQYGECVKKLIGGEVFVAAGGGDTADAGAGVDGDADAGMTSVPPDDQPTDTDEPGDRGPGGGDTSGDDTSNAEDGTGADGETNAGADEASDNESKSSSDGCSVSGDGQNASTGVLLLVALSWLGASVRRRRS